MQVVGGSNTAWADAELSSVKQRAASAGIVLLQREVPEQVTAAVVQAFGENELDGASHLADARAQDHLKACIWCPVDSED